jgi:beta-lactamase regulating signal transducer with metallopeptidase domain
MNFPADPYWADILNKLALQSRFNTGIELLESALVRSPLTIGHLKPVILFPIGLINRLSESEVEAILAHELAHILRRDYIFNILQSVVEVVFYFHPAVWWLSAQVRQERESACDDRAIALVGNKMNYAKALVTIQEMAFFPLSPALASTSWKNGLPPV